MIRIGHAAENMSTLLRLALNSVKGEKSLKIGVAAKRKRAGWDLEYLRAILRLAQLRFARPAPPAPNPALLPRGARALI